MKSRALKFDRGKGTLARAWKMASCTESATSPFAWHPAPASGAASKWTSQRLLLTVWKNNQPSFPFAKRSSEALRPRIKVCGPEACHECAPLAESQAYQPLLMGLLTPQSPHHQPAPSLEDLNMFDCKWMFLSVFNAVFPVLSMTTQDSNTEISKFFFSPQNITNLKVCHNRNLGFVWTSVLMWERQFKEN